jgi:hypothetical protein
VRRVRNTLRALAGVLVVAGALAPSPVQAARGTKPIIQGFTPKSGKPGTKVAIAGLNLSGVKVVRFGPASARFISVTPQLLVATVPRGARTGKIVVTSRSGSAKSPAIFRV